MARSDEGILVSVEQLTLASLLQVTALLELLEEKGASNRNDVLERMRAIRDRKKAD